MIQHHICNLITYFQIMTISCHCVNLSDAAFAHTKFVGKCSFRSASIEFGENFLALRECELLLLGLFDGRHLSVGHVGGTKITKKHTKRTETIYKLQKMTIGQAPRFAGVICVGRNQFLCHVPRFAGFDCMPRFLTLYRINANRNTKY